MSSWEDDGVRVVYRLDDWAFADSAEYLSTMTKSYPCGLLDMVFVDIASNFGAVLGVDSLGDSFLTAV